MGFDSHWVRFQLQKWAYLEHIARCGCGPDGLRFKTFDWGGTGGLVSPNFFYTLVYDESDEIALSADKRTAAWKRKVGSGIGSQLYSILEPEDERHSINVKLIERHFYLVTEIYQ
jgi:hypothetical protein